MEAMALTGTLGFGFAGAVGLGVFLGYRLDLALGWSPLCFTLALGLLGSAAGMVFVLRRCREMESRERRRRDRSENRDE